ncbi:GPR1/FUN34/YaaH family transporter [Umezawaea beigongshangensis]|uniref:GPR1/FUN34/YaaH family transporter n=1 Tax=Umezawaea beigongshangensis TaxID=2780383 RepID=UPI0018F22D44|nr:GPR1/FUN34/YaaH family transporter [Umezawaea beigongshangensis]
MKEVSAEPVKRPDEAQEPGARPVQFTADPSLPGFAGFLIGSISLALYLVDYSVAANSLVASLPIMVFSSSILLLMAARWSMRLGDGVFAAIYGLFGTFWLSFAVLSVTLNNNLLGEFENIEQRAATANFVVVWAIVIILLTVTTLHLPAVFTLLFVIVDVTLLSLFGSINQAIERTINNPTQPGDPWLIYVGMVSMLLFILVGMYIFASAMNAATGGKRLPLGRPLRKRR